MQGRGRLHAIGEELGVLVVLVILKSQISCISSFECLQTVRAGDMYVY
jgi:hypothetical protein